LESTKSNKEFHIPQGSELLHPDFFDSDGFSLLLRAPELNTILNPAGVVPKAHLVVSKFDFHGMKFQTQSDF
jgi:hypothetical protein